MSLNSNLTFLVIISLLSLVACNNGPKVIKSSSETPNSESSSGIFSDENGIENTSDSSNSFVNDLHNVKVNEVLKSPKYLYLNVTENGEDFWIATRVMDVSVGQFYYYIGGLLKTNYESKEYNRVFEKIYLVSSKLVEANHGVTGNTMNSNTTTKTEETHTHTTTEPQKIVVKAGSIKISELVKDPKKYEGKIVQLSGVCTKVNANIMGKNWIHIKDGSEDDYDLVLTSYTFVPEGAAFTMKGVVTLNKDFGAGYKYDLIIEEGVLIP